MTTVGSIFAPGFKKPTLSLNEKDMTKMNDETIEKASKQIADALNALSISGKVQVNSHYHNVMKEHEEVYRTANKIEKEFHTGINSYPSIDAFKEAGGRFDKDGTAYIINPVTGKEEKFNGVIRINYQVNPKTHVFSQRMEAWGTRDSAKFDDNGILTTIAHLEYSGAKVDEITYHEDGNRTAVISSKSTEVVPRKHSSNVKNDILKKYCIQ